MVARWLATALLGWGSLGCWKSAEPTMSPAGPPGMGPPMGGPGMGGPSPAEVEAKLPGGGEFAAGKRVYAAQGCVRCHKLGETGGGPPGGMMGGPFGPPKGVAPGGAPPAGPPAATAKGGPKGWPGGPDLTAVGREPDHTAEWLAAHVRNPKSHTPDSRMPAYGPEKIPDADLQALAAYLASRK